MFIRYAIKLVRTLTDFAGCREIEDGRARRAFSRIKACHLSNREARRVGILQVLQPARSSGLREGKFRKNRSCANEKAGYKYVLFHPLSFFAASDSLWD